MQFGVVNFAGRMGDLQSVPKELSTKESTADIIFPTI